MQIVDHYRPGGCPTTFTAFAAPVGSRADVVLVYVKNGTAHFHRLDDGRRPQDLAGHVSVGWMADRVIDKLGQGLDLPYGAMPLPQLVPFRSRNPILTATLTASNDTRLVSPEAVYRPWPGTTSSRLPYLIVSVPVETVDGSKEVSGFAMTHDIRRSGTVMHDFRVLASGPDGQFACGRILKHVTHEMTKYRDLVNYPPWYGVAELGDTPTTRPALVGDSGHGIWAYRNRTLLFVPEGEGPEPKAYKELFEDLAPHTLSYPQTMYELGTRHPILSMPRVTARPVELLAVSPRHAVRIRFRTGKDGEVEMVFDRRRLDPYSDRFEQVDGWTVPAGLTQASTQQTGVCAFISPGEEALLTYIPVYTGGAGVGGVKKQLLVRTICMDLD